MPRSSSRTRPGSGDGRKHARLGSGNRSDFVRLPCWRSIPENASVTAPLPYLSHLALREELHSLHYILKGLKTLSRQPFNPPQPTEFVLIDYNDSATFDRDAGYYHPTMRTVEGQIIPSSDLLLAQLPSRKGLGTCAHTDELTLLHQSQLPKKKPWQTKAQSGATRRQGQLLPSRNQLKTSLAETLEIAMSWRFPEMRTFSHGWNSTCLPQESRSPSCWLEDYARPKRTPEIMRSNGKCDMGDIPPGTYMVKRRLLR